MGQGRAGKTSTLGSLNGRALDAAQPSTIGIASEALVCELSQGAIKSWRPSNDRLDAVETAFMHELRKREQGVCVCLSLAMCCTHPLLRIHRQGRAR